MLHIKKYPKITTACCAFVVFAFVCIPLMKTPNNLLVPGSLVLKSPHVPQLCVNTSAASDTLFQRLDKHENAYVYSAYHDNGHVRLVGLARRGVQVEPKFCQFFTENCRSILMDTSSSKNTFECPRTSDLYIEYIPEEHGRM